MNEIKPVISIEDFGKLDIRVGTVIAAERVPDTDKLIKFELDFGDHKRQIIGGFGINYSDPSVLIGTQLPALINLELRVLRGLESQGMILGTSDKESNAIVLHPGTAVESGSAIR